MLPTKERLAQKLHSLGLFDLEREARAGQFSDFENDKYAMPKQELVRQLTRAAAEIIRSRTAIIELINEVMQGKWDDTREESQAWLNG